MLRANKFPITLFFQLSSQPGFAETVRFATALRKSLQNYNFFTYLPNY